jgi:alpha-mannosidase
VAEATAKIFVVPSFHYDVAYLKSYDEYLPICFSIMDEALRILGRSPQYRFLIEQVILLEEYWNRFESKRPLLQRFAREGRLTVAPGMFVMPDMNHPCGESMFMQAKVGKQWLREKLGIEADVCWIADCWGHHAQLPQILQACGYSYYVFWRCMRRDALRGAFQWAGIDGTTIRTHWLAKGYGNLRFPSQADIVNAPDLELAGCGPAQVRALCEELRKYNSSPALMLCNGGDFMQPQASAPDVLARLNSDGTLPPLKFAGPGKFLESIDWASAPQVSGEFNSALQGTFTSNIRIKQRNRQLTGRLLSLEALSVVAGQPRDYEPIWRILLKQQFHDIICGTICDKALRECLAEFDAAEAQIDEALGALSEPSAAPAYFNPLSFDRAEVIERDGARLRVELPPLGFAKASDAQHLPDAKPVALPCEFETPRYRAQIGADGHLISVVTKPSGSEIVANRGTIPFGSLGMQLDYGDLWLNFESPLSGGTLESALTQNHRDPYDRSQPGEIVNRGTFRPAISRATAEVRGDEELLVRQEGVLSFWRLSVSFVTQVRLSRSHARIEYETTIQPVGRHYRIRAAFPSAIAGGMIRYEIPYGIQERGQAEHIAQNWMDYSDQRAGLALLNAGTPGCTVDDGILLLTLFRSAAMEYKAESALSSAEGVPHTFRYAIVPHSANEDVLIVRNGWAFNRPSLPCAIAKIDRERFGISGADNVFISALRASGGCIFLRVYEAIGQPARARLQIPREFQHVAPANGQQQPTGEFQSCACEIPLTLKPFEIRGFLFQ